MKLHILKFKEFVNESIEKDKIEKLAKKFLNSETENLGELSIGDKFEIIKKLSKELYKAIYDAKTQGEVLNQKLAKMTKDGKPEEEIEKFQATIEFKIDVLNSKQEAIINKMNSLCGDNEKLAMSTQELIDSCTKAAMDAADNFFNSIINNDDDSSNKNNSSNNQKDNKDEKV